MTTQNDPAANPDFARIAHQYLGIELLVSRGRDRLDFHDLHVRNIAHAIEAAYALGRASASMQTPADLGAEAARKDGAA